MTAETRRLWWKVAEHFIKNLMTTAVWWFLVRPIPIVGSACVVCVVILWGFWLALPISAVICSWLDWRDRDGAG